MVFSFYHIDSGVQAQDARLGSKYLPTAHGVGPQNNSEALFVFIIFTTVPCLSQESSLRNSHLVWLPFPIFCPSFIFPSFKDYNFSQLVPSLKTIISPYYYSDTTGDSRAVERDERKIRDQRNRHP